MIRSWLDRRAARRLLRVLFESVDREKTADQLTAEGFLWLVLDEEATAEICLAAAVAARRPKTPPPPLPDR